MYPAIYLAESREWEGGSLRQKRVIEFMQIKKLDSVGNSPQILWDIFTVPYNIDIN
jgi:hypothetical protein